MTQLSKLIDLRQFKEAVKLAETDEIHQVKLCTIYGIEIWLYINCKNVKIKRKRCFVYTKGLFVMYKSVRGIVPRYLQHRPLDNTSYRTTFRSLQLVFDQIDLRKTSQAQNTFDND